MKFKLVSIDSIQRFDTHMHSVQHGPMEMKQFNLKNITDLIDMCAKKEIKTICLTEHIPFPLSSFDPTPNKDCAIEKEKWVNVLTKNKEYIKKYAQQKGVSIAIGGEYDFFPRNNKFYNIINQIIKPEIKILGLHFVDNITVVPNDEGIDCYNEKIAIKTEKQFCFDYSEKAFQFAINQIGIKKIISRYFSLLTEAIQSQRYDIVAHIDLINKYNQNNKYFVEDEAYRKLLIQVLSFMQKKQLLLEVNLGGIKATGQLVPRGWIIKEAIKLNIPITIGSDIHNCDEISNEVWKFAIKNLKKVGLKTIAVPIIKS